MSKSSSSGQSSDLNITYSNMTSKPVSRNVIYLKREAKQVKNKALKEKADTLIQLYEDRKLTQLTTAEKQIKAFQNYDKEKPKKQEKIDQKYIELVTKYKDAKALNVRMRTNKWVSNLTVGDPSKAKTDITIYIKKQKNEMLGRDFVLIHNSIYDTILEQTKKLLEVKRSMKVQTAVEYTVTKAKQEPGDVAVSNTRVENSKSEQVTESGLDETLQNQKIYVENKLNQIQMDSLAILQISKIIITVYSTRRARGSSYIPTPAPYNNAKCGLVNIQNEDEMCFKWCMKYHQTPQAKNNDRVSVLKKVADKYNYDNIEFPTTYEDIKQFETDNELCINVYTIDPDNGLVKDYIGNIHYIRNDIVHLLRVESEGGDSKSHYVYIKHIQRLLNLKCYSHGKEKRFCPYCDKNVNAEDFFTKHVHECYKRACADGSLLRLPEEGAVMKFKNYKNKLERPFIVYCDTESTLQKTNETACKSEKIHRHVTNSCCYYFVCTFDSSRNYIKTFEGENCVEDMIVELKELADTCVLEMRKNQEMKLTPEDKLDFENATTCSICGECFTEGEMTCRDHDHRTGKYRGATHAKCNINYFCNRYLPVVFHNLKGYDSHFIIRKAYDIAKRMGHPKISAIPNSYEKFMSFEIGSLKFIDSFQFMASSLENLVDNLYEKGAGNKYKNFDNMKKEFSPEHLDLLCRKGFYPYEWMDSAEKLNHKGLPAKEEFYSTLKKEGITEDDYNHATNVYEKLNCKSFRDYHMTYLKCDVLLLADVFENFRRTCLNYYELDPANYITAPGLSWDAMLKMTKMELELIHDPKILDIIERQKRGGLTFVGSKRHVKANNKYVEGYDKSKPDNSLMYWDANNLYGWAMSESLPYKDIEFSNVDLDTVLNTPDDDETGYILEVDLHVPKNTHDKLKEYPPCPENMAIDEHMLSKYQKQMAVKNKVKFNNKSTKLVPHLMDKIRYCIHYRNLKYVVGLGLEVKKVHNIISFKQKRWLKEYIDLNTEKRKQAKNDFEKDFFKLMNNSCFGKTMENVKNRVELYLTVEEEKATKWFSKIHFKTAKEFESLYLIEMFKKEIVYDKPIYVGTSVLDLSKLHMMRFHYEVIQPNFENNYELIYSDTDSLTYNIKHPDVYKWVKDNSSHFDLSDDKYMKDDTNKKVLGKFKDELEGIPMKSFTALNPKVYCFDYAEKDVRKCKGVSKAVVKKELKNSDFKKVLDTGESINKDVYGIRSFKHEVFTVRTEKTCLTNYYDKMYMTDYNTCVPYGHYSIK